MPQIECRLGLCILIPNPSSLVVVFVLPVRALRMISVEVNLIGEFQKTHFYKDPMRALCTRAPCVLKLQPCGRSNCYQSPPYSPHVYIYIYIYIYILPLYINFCGYTVYCETPLALFKLLGLAVRVGGLKMNVVRRATIPLIARGLK